MSKIVCDICGTSYAETAKQCPICGSVHPGDVQRVTNEVKKDGKVSTGYTHVKGGRFSKSNVKKRTKAQNGGKTGSKSSPKKNNDEEKANRGLVLLAIMLLLAIIGVVTYLAIRFFSPIADPSAGNPTGNPSANSDLACKEITLDTYSITFDQLGISKQLRVDTVPEKPSENITFESTHPEVATVSNGRITPVANGTTEIKVSCGSITKICKVTVQLVDNNTNSGDTTIPTEPDTTTPDESPTEVLKLSRIDECKLDFKGHSWDLYNESCNIDRNKIEWSVDDSTIATMQNGKVVAVNNGTTYITAEYKGQIVRLKIVCEFKEGSGVDGNGGVSEDGGGSSTTYKTGVISNVNENANLRSTPGIKDDNKAGTIELGTKVTVYEQVVADGYTWCKIGDGRWVASNFIKFD